MSGLLLVGVRTDGGLLKLCSPFGVRARGWKFSLALGQVPQGCALPDPAIPEDLPSVILVFWPFEGTKAGQSLRIILMGFQKVPVFLQFKTRSDLETEGPQKA